MPVGGRARAEPRPDYYLAVEVVATGELVGFARLGLGGGGHRSGEVGYAIRRIPPDTIRETLALYETLMREDENDFMAADVRGEIRGGKKLDS